MSHSSPIQRARNWSFSRRARIRRGGDALTSCNILGFARERTITTRNVSTVEQRKLAESRRQLEQLLASLGEAKSFATEWLNRVHAMSTEAASLVKCRDELKVMAKMIDGGSHAGSAATTGLASRGNRSSIDAGKRNSLTRERPFAELENHPPKTRRDGSEG